MQRYAAEAIGTFVLVFAGTGAVVVDDVSGGSLSTLGVALVFAFAVMTMIQSVGDVSGAHLNPAVSFGFWLARRLPPRELAGYVASQTLGALAASLVVRGLFPGHPTLGATLPSGAAAQSFLLEVLLGFFLMFVILGVSTGSKEKGLLAGVAVGGIVGLGALVGGPISGGSLNPARSLAPALVSGSLGSLWIYLAAPTLGAGLAVLACRCVREPGCCAARTEGPRSTAA